MRRLRRALAAGVVLAALWAPAAGAHSGGRAQLYVDSVHLTPDTDGWQAELVLRDADSGKPEPGFGVTIRATGTGEPVGPVALTDPDGDGTYAALVPLAPGTWTVFVDAAEIPGGPRGLPFARSWPATLEPGQALALGSARESSGGRGGGLTTVTVALAVGLAGAGALARVRRRNTRGKMAEPRRT